MPTIVPDRLSLRTVRLDYWRSLTQYNSGRRDVYGALVVFCLPPLLGALSIWPLKLVVTVPVALLPAVTLLAGVLLAAAGQVLTMRARIADSLTLSTDARVVRHVRETMSGLILAAVASLLDALLLGVLAAVLTTEHRWWHYALSAAIVMVTAYISLMFVVAARRLYITYLEVFENGSPLGKIRR